MYKRKEEFVSQLLVAISKEPTPLSAEHVYTLTWEAASERCAEASKITRREASRRSRIGQTKRDERALKSLKSPVAKAVQRVVSNIAIGIIVDDHNGNDEIDSEKHLAHRDDRWNKTFYETFMK